MENFGVGYLLNKRHGKERKGKVLWGREGVEKGCSVNANGKKGQMAWKG